MISIADFRKELPLNIQKNMYIGWLIHLVTEKYGHKIDYDVYLPTKGKNLQRPFCWSIEQKRELIKSVLK